MLSWGWCTTEPAPQNVTPEGRFQCDHFLVPCYAHPLDSENCLNQHIHPAALRDWANTENVDLGWIFAGTAFTAVMAEHPFAWLIKRNVEFIRQIGGQAVTTCLEIGEADDRSVRGDMTDHYLFSACGVNYFAMSRLAWKAAAPLEELYRDYAEARFGQAAGELIVEYYGKVIERYEAWGHPQPSEDFYDVWGGSEVRCRPGWEVPLDLLTGELIVRSRELLEEAHRRAQRTVHKQRVRAERNVFEHTVRMREIFKIHQARQKLEDAGTDRGVPRAGASTAEDSDGGEGRRSPQAPRRDHDRGRQDVDRDDVDVIPRRLMLSVLPLSLRHLQELQPHLVRNQMPVGLGSRIVAFRAPQMVFEHDQQFIGPDFHG